MYPTVGDVNKASEASCGENEDTIVLPESMNSCAKEVSKTGGTTLSVSIFAQI
jgi:hypothetical protein